MRSSILAFIIFALNMPVIADQNTNLFNVVSLQAAATKDVVNDQVTVRLQAQYEGPNSSTAANKINTQMQWALQQAQAFADIEAETHAYTTYPLREKNSIIGWRAVQTLQLRGNNTQAMTELVARLQTKLTVQNMSFAPSRASQQQAEHALIEQAMQAFNNKVDIIKRTMEQKNVRIVKLDITTGSAYASPKRMEMMSMRSAQEMTSPAVKSGTSEIKVTVTGSVQFY